MAELLVSELNKPVFYGYSHWCSEGEKETVLGFQSLSLTPSIPRRYRSTSLASRLYCLALLMEADSPEIFYFVSFGELEKLEINSILEDLLPSNVPV